MAELRIEETGDRLVWAALSAFHITVLMTALFIYLQAQGDIGSLLGGLGSGIGNGVYLWLAIVTTWTTYRAMREHPIAWPDQDPWPSMWLRGVLWSSINGALFMGGLLLVIATIALVSSLVSSLASVSAFDTLAALQGAFVFGVYALLGLLAAAIVGAMLGVVIVSFDLIALAMGRRMARTLLEGEVMPRK